MNKLKPLSYESLVLANPCPICGAFPLLEVRQVEGRTEQRCQCSNEYCVTLRATWRLTEEEAVRSWNRTGEYKTSNFRQFRQASQAKRKNNGILHK